VHVKTVARLSERTNSRSTALDRLARSIVAAGAAPAAVCAAGFRRADQWIFALGSAGTLWPIAATPITPDVVFDLASITKAVVAIAAATESVRGGLAWSSLLQEVLPEVEKTWAATASLEQLFSHRAGLKPHIELFRQWQAGRSATKSELLKFAARAANGDSPPAQESTRAVYSDLGYLLAGAALERHSGVALDTWLSSALPSSSALELGSVRQWFVRDPTFLRRCAPTELVPWRRGLVWGRVHDENAWVLGGLGACGHAGLFGTAIGVARFGAVVVDALCGRSSEVPEAAAQLSTRPRSGGSLRAGFDGVSGTGSTAGTSASPATFGHLGFTGTSLWCDPARSLVTVVLSNRVCPQRGNVCLRSLRARMHEALFNWAESGHFDQPT